MSEIIVDATNAPLWRETTSAFPKVDVCQMPEYHVTYSARVPNSRALLWTYRDGDSQFSYPLLLTPATLSHPDGAVEPSDYFDISSIYGYSGPLCTSQDGEFRSEAWLKFDEWALGQKVIADFTRFSVYADNRGLAHPEAQVERNRPVATFQLSDDEDEILAALNSKTRNMIRKAWKADLTARELDPRDVTASFRALYEETMERNEAPGFFLYDDQYYRDLLSGPAGDVRLFGVFAGQTMVAAAIALVHEAGALYHLGASQFEYSRLGAGNLSMFEMARCLGRDGVRFLNLGGGRTTEEDDPLFRFKRSNGSGVADFYIGKRVIDARGYDEVVERWTAIHGRDVDSPQLIFYR